MVWAMAMGRSLPLACHRVAFAALDFQAQASFPFLRMWLSDGAELHPGGRRPLMALSLGSAP